MDCVPLRSLQAWPRLQEFLTKGFSLLESSDRRIWVGYKAGEGDYMLLIAYDSLDVCDQEVAVWGDEFEVEKNDAVGVSLEGIKCKHEESFQSRVASRMEILAQLLGSKR